MVKNCGRDRFEKSRDCGKPIAFRAAIDIDRIDEMKLAPGARRGDIKQAPLFLEIVKLIAKTI